MAQLLNAIRSMNKYDSEKDMTTADGTEVEVKTQVPWYAENAFTLDLAKKTNFDKCMKVDRLIFVEIPRNDVIKVYECVDRRGGWTSTTSKGRRMYCLPISEMNLLPLQPGDVPDTWADTEDLAADVGYQPATPIEEGVRNFVEWYLDFYKER